MQLAPSLSSAVTFVFDVSYVYIFRAFICKFLGFAEDFATWVSTLSRLLRCKSNVDEYGRLCHRT